MRLVVSPSAAVRRGEAEGWLASRGAARSLLVVGASLEAAADLVHGVASGAGGAFGWHRATLARVASTIAAPELARRGLTGVGALVLEALSARVLDRLRREDRLGRLSVVASQPGVPRAVSRTLRDLRAARVGAESVHAVSPELAALHEAFAEELAEARLADRALVMELALAAGPRHGYAGLPLLFLDVPCATSIERELIAALAAGASDVLATVPTGDERGARAFERALGVSAEVILPTAARRAVLPAQPGLPGFDPPPKVEVPPEEETRGFPPLIARLQRGLFVEESLAEPAGEELVVLSAPGESRECVEVARLVQREAERGVPFDRMAIVLRAPQQYRAPLEEALRRGGVPACFADGTVRPDPSGRALLALLAAKAEGLSARRFAEYLSLGEVPDATDLGEPPPATDAFVPPDEELVPSAITRSGASEARSEPKASEGGQDELASPRRPPSDPDLQPVIDGALRTPRRWERLLVDSAVIGGLDRWERRLAGWRHELEADIRAAAADPVQVERKTRDLRDLDALTTYALPILRELDALPERATWGEWLHLLTGLSTRALRDPERVLAVFSELAPMRDIGPVSLAELRLVLARKLTDLVERPEPRRAGRLLVAPIEAVRGLSFEVVFIPGLAEKIFPQKISEDPILKDDERAALSEELETNADRAAAERFALRLAVGAAREKVIVSYPRVDMDQGRPRVPSFYGLELLRAAEGKLPGFAELARRAEKRGAARIAWPAPSVPTDALDEAEHDLALLDRLFRLSEGEATGTARYLLTANPHLARALRARARRWTVRTYTPADGLVKPSPEARAALAKHALSARSYSPTALQTFASCPYRFLLHGIHKLSPREEPEAIEELDPLQKGSLVHEIQFELLGELREAGLLPITQANLHEARRRLDAVVARVASRFKEDLAPAIDRVWDDGIGQIAADLHEWLRRHADPDDPHELEWTPERFELSFGLPERRPRDPSSTEDPVVLDIGVTLRGSIDLVERKKDGAIRVTDHKTGKQRAQDGVVIGGGEILQPVLYALALEKLLPDTRVESGRLYYCTHNGGFSTATVNIDDEARKAAQLVADTIEGALDEGFLPAAPAEGACTFCDFAAVCGPDEELRVRRAKTRIPALTVLREHP